MTLPNSAAAADDPSPIGASAGSGRRDGTRERDNTSLRADCSGEYRASFELGYSPRSADTGIRGFMGLVRGLFRA